MILDSQNVFGQAQAVTSSAASTNIIDQGAAGDAYSDNGLYLQINCDASATAAGAATVDFQLQTATDAAFTIPVVLFDSGAIGKASLTAGSSVAKLKVPVGALRYLRVMYTVATGPLTAGAFSAFLVRDIKIGNQ